MNDETGEGFIVEVIGLVRDGATSWIADVRIPAFGVEWQGVYLGGATEEEAYSDATRAAREWYERSRQAPRVLFN